jgi:hypothetical protein
MADVPFKERASVGYKVLRFLRQNQSNPEMRLDQRTRDAFFALTCDDLGYVNDEPCYDDPY